MTRHAAQTKQRRDAARMRPYNPSDHWHGSAAGYSNHCCRCEDCRAAFKAYHDEWRKRPEVAARIRDRARVAAKRPDQVLRRKATQYGLDVDLLASHLAERECFACGAKDVTLAIDHDHACCPSTRGACGECVRGLLCLPCNKTLGMVKDSTKHLLNLVAYLDRWEQERARQ